MTNSEPNLDEVACPKAFLIALLTVLRDSNQNGQSLQVQLIIQPYNGKLLSYPTSLCSIVPLTTSTGDLDPAWNTFSM